MSPEYTLPPFPDSNLDNQRPNHQAFIYVRNVRYAELTGPIHTKNPKTGLLELLGGTGWEGWLIGRPPEEIVRIITSKGKQIDQNIISYVKYEEPRFADSHNTSLLTEAQLIDALCEGKIPPAHEQEIRSFFNSEFECLLAEFPEMILPNYRREFDKFREETYQRVHSGQIATPVREITLPKLILEEVLEKPTDVKYFRIMTKMARWGDPEERKKLQSK